MALSNKKFIDGYCFKFKSKRISWRLFYCSERAFHQCSSYGHELSSGEFVVFGEHTHLPTIDMKQSTEFHEALKNSTTASMDDFRPIYDSIAKKYPQAAASNPFVKKERSMRSWRSKVRPNRPATLQAWSTTLNSDQWKHLKRFDGGDLTVSYQPIGNKGGGVTMMADVQMLQRISSTQFCIDGTFEPCPRLPNRKNLQLLTIMAVIDDTCVPVMWTLMNTRTTRAYRVVLQQFSMWAPQIQPEEFIVDFEQALTSAIRDAYQNATIVHCWFHYLQALTRRLNKKSKRARDYLKQWDQGKNFYQKLMALPLLPSEDMQAAYDWLVSNATPEQKIYFKDILQYISRYWLSRVGVRNFCVFGHKRRTNNPIEAYHRTLRSKIGRRPPIWKFTEKLVTMVSVVKSEVISLDNLEPVRRPVEKRYAMQEKIIQRCWELYENGVFDIPKFFSCSNHLLRAYQKQLLVQSLADVDYFVVAPTHDINAPVPLNPVAIEEMPPDFGRLPILTLGNGQLVPILLFRDLNMSQCKICLNRIVEYVTIPCNHWYCCKQCTYKLRQLAINNESALRCIVCQDPIIAFNKVTVS